MIIIINRMLVYMHNIHACDSIYRKESIYLLFYVTLFTLSLWNISTVVS